jgi:ribose 5-phosphate isomerase A
MAGAVNLVRREMSDTPKRNAAAAAVALVKDGMRLGIGTGSTAAHFVDLLGARVRAGLRVVGVPTSERTAAQCRELGIALSTLDETPELDLAIDGADEFDVALNLIKGGGGALLREKIVAAAAARFVVIADAGKRVTLLGAFPLPVEIIALARGPLSARIAALGAAVRLRVVDNGRPFVTDEGHWILDCAFGATITDPAALAAQLSAMAGVVEHGLFCGMAEQVIIGLENGVEIVD